MRAASADSLDKIRGRETVPTLKALSRKFSQITQKYIQSIAVAIAVALIGISVGILLRGPMTFNSHPATDLAVTGTSLGSKGWVTFSLRNYGQADISIVTIEGRTGAVPAGPPDLGTLSLSSNNTVSALGSLNLAVQFQGETWNPGATYTFTLIDSTGFPHPTAVCISGC